MCYFGGSLLHALSRELGRAQPFYALQFPGLNGTQIPESFDELAQQHIALIKKTQPRGPYLLGGHSSGGAVAFEIARQLEAAGDTVQLLAIFDTTVAQVEEDDNPYEGFTEEDWVREMLVLFGEDPDSVPGLVIDDEGALIPVEETYVHVRDFLARHRMLAGNSSLEQVRALLNVFKTISLAHAAYRPAGPVAAPIRLFIAEELPMRGVRLDQREAGWGWPALTTGGVEVIRVPGNHIDMLNDPRVVSVAQKLAPCLQPAPRLGLDEAASVY